MTILGAGQIVVPTMISGLKAWWDADVGVFNDAGITPAAVGDSVQQWRDLSGNGNNLSQATAGFRPTLQTRGGLRTIRFDGVDDVLTKSANSSLDFGNTFSIFVVFTVGVAFTDYTFITKGANAYQGRFAGTGHAQMWKDTVGNLVAATDAFLNANAFYRCSMRCDTTPARTIYMNNLDVSGGINTFVCADNAVDLKVGAGDTAEFLAGEIRALCLFNTYITVQNIYDLTEYYHA